MQIKMPAIGFEPDGYSISGDRLMGRQAAGHAFLRAAVTAASGRTLGAYTPHRSSAQTFAHMVRQLDAAVAVQWIPSARLDLLARQELLYLPGPGLDESARLRLRAGPAAYSICGVTHTTASHRAMDAIRQLAQAPVMPWDALICTSTSVLNTVRTVLAREQDYLQWRFGHKLSLTLPQLPVIPLGVHVDDFVRDDAARAAARAELGLAPDEVAVLFVGRLSFHAKAHPHAMYQGLQRAAEQSGKRLVLIQCGWFANEAIEKAFKDGAVQVCPDVRALFANGKDEASRRRAWAAADVFISLSDNIQETFGLTPIEAMAAGLPVVVSDWDGYKDTVRDGEDGYRIPTRMPAAGYGEALALAHESGLDNYDQYCGLACQAVAMDQAVLVERLVALIESPALRQRLGQQARQRAREVFDWSVIWARYEALWAELSAMRAQAQQSPRWEAALRGAPKADAARLDPFEAFASYPTAHLDAHSRVAWAPGQSAAQVEALLKTGLFSYLLQRPPLVAALNRVMSALADTPVAVQALNRVCATPGVAPPANPLDVMAAVSLLLKIDAVRLHPAGA